MLDLLNLPSWTPNSIIRKGYILAPHQRYSVGEQMRGILRLIVVNSTEEMQNQVEFFSVWIGYFT